MREAREPFGSVAEKPTGFFLFWGDFRKTFHRRIERGSKGRMFHNEQKNINFFQPFRFPILWEAPTKFKTTDRTNPPFIHTLRNIPPVQWNPVSLKLKNCTDIGKGEMPRMAPGPRSGFSLIPRAHRSREKVFVSRLICLLSSNVGQGGQLMVNFETLCIDLREKSTPQNLQSIIILHQKHQPMQRQNPLVKTQNKITLGMALVGVVASWGKAQIMNGDPKDPAMLGRCPPFPGVIGYPVRRASGSPATTASRLQGDAPGRY